MSTCLCKEVLLEILRKTNLAGALACPQGMVYISKTKKLCEIFIALLQFNYLEAMKFLLGNIRVWCLFFRIHLAGGGFFYHFAQSIRSDIKFSITVA